MKKIPIFLFLGLFAACNAPKQEEVKVEENTIEMKETEVAQPDSVLRHHVYFGFKESVSPENIQKVVDAFRNLQNEIDGIESFEWGTNSSPEGLNQGLTHAFTLTFHSNEARDAYLPHPAHKAFGELLGPYLDKVTVVDYWTRR